MTAFSRLLALAVAAAVAVAALASAGNGSASLNADWICVYVDHVHVTVCQDKPVDFHPDDATGSLLRLL